MSHDHAPLLVALTGDSCITRRLSIFSEPAFLTLREKIRGAHAAFTNLETLFHDYESYAMHESHGSYVRSDPALAKELEWLGINLLSLANNHAGDYGVAGMRSTIRCLRDAGLTFAGVSESLGEAREASFLDTPRGRIALIAVASTFPPHARAGKSRDSIPGRPGLNPLRHSRRIIVPREWLGRLEALLSEVVPLQQRGSDQLWMAADTVFQAGDSCGPVTEINHQVLNEIVFAVDNANQLADCIVVSLHSHESGASRAEPAPFIQRFAHAMIEAGADVVAGHGAHVLRGIEIYRNKPIFYGLGSFIYQSDSIQRFPADAYDAVGLGAEAHVADVNSLRRATTDFSGQPEAWESMLAVLHWQHGKVLEIELWPITLGFGGSHAERGRPMLAEPELGEKILNRLDALSRPFGTSIGRSNGAGIIRMDS